MESPQSVGFALDGALLIFPMILTYKARGHFVFRGKAHAGTRYH